MTRLLSVFQKGWRLIGKRLLRRSLRFTRQGKMYTAVTLGVGLAAVNTDNNLLFLVLGLMLGLIIVSGILSELTLMGLRVERRLDKYAEAVTVFPVELSVTNNKRLFASFGVELRDEIDGAPFKRRAFFLRIAPNEKRAIAYRCEIEKRGRSHFSGTFVTTRFPFGLFEKSRFVTVKSSVIVLPKPIPVAVPRPPASLGEGVKVSIMKGRGQEYRELRELAPGDDPRLIDWRATARLGIPMVRENESDSAAFLELVLDPSTAKENTDWDPEAEERISAAATITKQLLSSGIGIRLVTTPGTVIERHTPEGALSILECLALLDTKEARHSPSPVGTGALSLLIGPRAKTRGQGKQLSIPPFFKERT